VQRQIFIHFSFTPSKLRLFSNWNIGSVVLIKRVRLYFRYETFYFQLHVGLFVQIGGVGYARSYYEKNDDFCSVLFSSILWVQSDAWKMSPLGKCSSIPAWNWSGLSNPTIKCRTTCAFSYKFSSLPLFFFSYPSYFLIFRTLLWIQSALFYFCWTSYRLRVCVQVKCSTNLWANESVHTARFEVM
jgi:hypothetical protein